MLKIDPVQLRRGIGYVIQQGGLFPHRRVADNVATVPRLLGWDTTRVNARVEELLELVGSTPTSTANGSRTSSRAASASGSAWPGLSAAIHRSC